MSVGYRLAPEHPYPAAIDDCEEVTRWVHENRAALGVPDGPVAVAGESAGGNLAATVSLRLRDRGEDFVAGQVLIYPATTAREVTPSRAAFDGLVISLAACEQFTAAYSGGQDLEGDPYAFPLAAEDLSGLPPAIVVLGGCDMLRDEGRAYGEKMRAAGVSVKEVCYAGQPHGFVNFGGFPAADAAFEEIGTWLRRCSPPRPRCAQKAGSRQEPGHEHAGPFAQRPAEAPGPSADLPLGQLDHHSGRAFEKDKVAVVEVHDLVSGPDPGGGQCGERGDEVVDPETDVVEAGSAQVLGVAVDDDRRVVEPQQLHLLVDRRARVAQGHVVGLPFGDAHIGGHLLPRDHHRSRTLESKLAEKRDRLVEVGNGDGHVVETGFHGSKVSYRVAGTSEL